MCAAASSASCTVSRTGELGVQARRLERATEAEPRAPVRRLAARASRGHHRSLGSARSRRSRSATSAGAIVADEPDDLSGRGVELDVVDRHQTAESDGEVVGGGTVPSALRDASGSGVSRRNDVGGTVTVFACGAGPIRFSTQRSIVSRT